MSMTQTLAPHLPYLRRYARALTGSQQSGDAHVRAALQALLAGDEALTEGVPPGSVCIAFSMPSGRAAPSILTQKMTRRGQKLRKTAFGPYRPPSGRPFC
jgi:hypothetical protein